MSVQQQKRARPGDSSLGVDSKSFEGEKIVPYVNRAITLLIKAQRTVDKGLLWKSKEEFDFYAVANPDMFNQYQSELSKRILSMMDALLLQKNTGDFSIAALSSGSSAGLQFSDFATGKRRSEELLDHFDPIVEFNDIQLEKVDAYSDGCLGLHNDGAKAGVQNTAVPTVAQASRLTALLGHAGREGIDGVVGSVGRPQLLFDDVIDNSDSPFVPKLLEKPNAQVPLDTNWLNRAKMQALSRTNRLLGNNEVTEVAPSTSTNPAFTGADSANNAALLVSAPHPYEYEIDHLEYTDEQLRSSPEIKPRPLGETPLHLVETKEQLVEMLDKLRAEQLIAIDLEHHDYRTYQGITCLMQVSSRMEDFIVDTLLLRSHLHMLNEVFTDPKVVKVLHGCDHDVIWLQRDFGLYLVNVFDTGQAARVLSLRGFGLAHLLDVYCGVLADKQYQMADWRLRPLPEVMLHYARTDTHYLLYLYDRLKNELIVRGNSNLNLLHSVLLRSRELAKQRYEKELLTSSSHLDLYHKSNHVFNARQLAALAVLYGWRDRLARQEDESLRYIMPNHTLLQIAQNCPSSTDELFRSCSVIPPYTRIYALEIIELIRESLLAAPAAASSVDATDATAIDSTTSNSLIASSTRERASIYVFADPGSLQSIAGQSRDEQDSKTRAKSAGLTAIVASDSLRPAVLFSEPRVPARNVNRLLDVCKSFDLSATTASFRETIVDVEPTIAPHNLTTTTKAEDRTPRIIASSFDPEDAIDSKKLKLLKKKTRRDHQKITVKPGVEQQPNESFKAFDYSAVTKQAVAKQSQPRYKEEQPIAINAPKFESFKRGFDPFDELNKPLARGKGRGRGGRPSR